LAFSKNLVWDGHQWRSKIVSWSLEKIDKPSSGEHLDINRSEGWHLVRFRHGVRGTGKNMKKKIIGAYYARQDASTIQIRYCEIVARGC